MARGDMLLILAGCMLLASVCLVQADRNERLRFVIHEHQDRANRVEVFGPRSRDNTDNSDSNRGRGAVYSNSATQKRDEQSERVANVSGLYFFVNDEQVQKIATIYFEDVGVNQDRRFANAQLHLRGVWNRDENEEKRAQEFAIVGGTRGLAGATGIVRYERIERGDTYKVVGDFQIAQITEESELL